MKKFLISIFLLSILMFSFSCKSRYSITTYESKIINKQVYISTGYVRRVIYVSYIDIGNDGIEINAIESELLYRTSEVGDMILVERKKGIIKGKFGNDSGVYILGWNYID